MLLCYFLKEWIRSTCYEDLNCFCSVPEDLSNGLLLTDSHCENRCKRWGLPKKSE